MPPEAEHLVPFIRSASARVFLPVPTKEGSTWHVVRAPRNGGLVRRRQRRKEHVLALIQGVRILFILKY